MSGEPTARGGGTELKGRWGRGEGGVHVDVDFVILLLDLEPLQVCSTWEPSLLHAGLKLDV